MMRKYPLKIRYRNPDTEREEVFSLVAEKGGFLIYLGEATFREILLRPEQALAAPRA